MNIAHQLVRLVVILMIIVAGKSVWARSRSPTSSYVGSRQMHYASLVEAACHDRVAAACVRQAGRMHYAPGLVNGVTRREAVVRQCLADFNRRQPELVKAEQTRVLLDLFKSDPNLAAPADTRLCRQSVTMARRETQAYLAERDREFHASRNRLRAREAVAVNNRPSSPIVREYPEPAGPTVVAQHQVEPPPELPAPAAPHVSTPDDGLGPNLVLRSADDRKAVVYARAGGQFYTVRSSWLRHKYNVDWKTVYNYPGNQNKDFVGACFIGRAVELDQARMHVKSYDATALNGPTNSSFVADCEQRGGEFRFALQGGQTFEIPALATSSAAPPVEKSSGEPPVEPSPAVAVIEEPAPAAPPVSASTAVPALALAPAVSAMPAVEPSAVTAAPEEADAGPDVSAEGAPSGSTSVEDASPAMSLTQDPGNRGPPGQDWVQWFAGWPSWAAVFLLLIFLVYLIYDMRKTRVGQDVIKHIKAWRARIGLWLDERRAGTRPPTV